MFYLVELCHKDGNELTTNILKLDEIPVFLKIVEEDYTLWSVKSIENFRFADEVVKEINDDDNLKFGDDLNFG